MVDMYEWDYCIRAHVNKNAYPTPPPLPSPPPPFIFPLCFRNCTGQGMHMFCAKECLAGEAGGLWCDTFGLDGLVLETTAFAATFCFQTLVLCWRITLIKPVIKWLEIAIRPARKYVEDAVNGTTTMKEKSFVKGTQTVPVAQIDRANVIKRD